MAYLLDSNVVSELWKPEPAAEVTAWLQASEWFVPVVVIAEIQEGAESSGSAVRRAQVTRRLEDFLRECDSLVVDWDSETALLWARLRHSAEVKRQPQALWDSLIDAMAVCRGLTVASRNHRDFRHALVFDPWTGKQYNRKTR
jgi:predicted nucleic acid-binding protein